MTAQAVVATYDSDSIDEKRWRIRAKGHDVPDTARHPVGGLAAVNAKDLRDDTPRAQFAILVRIEDEENVEKVRRLGVDQGDLAVHPRRAAPGYAGDGVG